MKMRPRKNKLTVVLECQAFQLFIATFCCRSLATISSEITSYFGNFNDYVFFKGMQYCPSCPSCQDIACREKGEAFMKASCILPLIVVSHDVGLKTVFNVLYRENRLRT